MPTAKVDKKTTHQSTSKARDKKSWWQEEEATNKKRWRPRWMGCSGARKGGGGNATTVMVDNKRQQQDNRQRHRQTRRWRDEMQCNNQPGWMRGNYTRELEGYNGMQGLKWWQDG